MKTFSEGRVFVFGGEMAQQLTKENLYQFYTENIRYADFQLDVLRRQIRPLAGEYYWYISNNKESQIRKKLIYELKALTNLYAYILGSRFELQLMKILHENSSVAFSEAELQTIIKRKGTTYDKWHKCLEISFQKSTDIDWTDVNGQNLLELFRDKSNYLKEFQEFITMRNRLAHGQWSTQLNSDGTKESTPDALNKYDDISKLVLLSKKLDTMVKIVETIVVYREKNNEKFKNKISNLIKENKIIDCRIKNSSLKKYVQLEINKFDKKKSRNR